jgi:hypothetical protein
MMQLFSLSISTPAYAVSRQQGLLLEMATTSTRERTGITKSPEAGRRSTAG